MLARGVLIVSIAVVTSACGLASTWTAGRRVASEALACPEDRFETVVPHSYNLGPADHVYRGCDREVVVRCATTSATTMCRPLYLSSR